MNIRGTEKESAEQQAEPLVTEELRRRKWEEGELHRRGKGDAETVRIAQRLRQETTMRLKWIARRLVMGTGANMANCPAPVTEMTRAGRSKF